VQGIQMRCLNPWVTKLGKRRISLIIRDYKYNIRSFYRDEHITGHTKEYDDGC